MHKILPFLLCLLPLCTSAQKQKNIDSIEQMVKPLVDTLKYEKLIYLGSEYCASDSSLALYCFRRAEKIAEKLNNPRKKGLADFWCGLTMLRNDKLKEGTEMLMRNMDYHQKLNIHDMAGGANYQIGNCYEDKGDYTEALDWYMKMLKYGEMVRDTQMIVLARNKVGYMYDRNSQFELALNWHKKTWPLINEQKAPGVAGWFRILLGGAYDNAGYSDSAIIIQKPAIAIYKKLKKTGSLVTILGNIGNSLNKLKRYSEANQYLSEALDTCRAHNLTGNLDQILINLATSKTNLGEYQLAKQYYTEGLGLAYKNTRPEFVQEALLRRSEMYEKMGDFNAALADYKAYKTKEDSLYSDENAEKLLEIREEYDATQRESEIKIQQLEIEKQKNRTKVLLITGGLLLLLVIGALGFWVFRTKSIAEAKLSEEALAFKQKLLSSTVLTQEEERKRIAKELHDGIGQQLVGVKMAVQQLSNAIATQLPEQAQQANKLVKVVDDAAVEVRSISHQMMPRALQELGLIPALEDMINNSLGNTKMKYNFEHFGVEGRLPEQIEVSFYRICQELVNNIIKHSGASESHISIIKNKTHLIMIVEDNGKGIGSNKDNNSLGMQSIASRVSTINGVLNFESAEAQGTVATIRVPLG